MRRTWSGDTFAVMRVDTGPTAEADKDCPKHIQPGAVLETRIVAVGKTEDHTTKSYFAVIQQRVHDAAQGAGSWSKADPVAVAATHIIALDSASKLEFRPGTTADVKAVSGALTKFGTKMTVSRRWSGRGTGAASSPRGCW